MQLAPEKLHPPAHHKLLALFQTMLTAREVDRAEEELVRQGHAFFQVSASGHEVTAAIAAHLTPHDYLHLHYRDKALLLARGVPIKEFFLNLLCRSGSHSGGRQMSAHYSARHLNVLSMVGPVGNNALQAVGVATAIKSQSHNPIVVCAVGDGTTQEGEFLEALAEAARQSVPVLFVIEDNGWAISTPTTGKTFFSNLGDGDTFLGIPLAVIDGTCVPDASERFATLVRQVRSSRSPRIVICRLERLCDHTNADDQTRYRDCAELARCIADADPLQSLERCLLLKGVAADEICQLKRHVAAHVRQAAEEALAAPEPAAEIEAKRPLVPSSMETIAPSQIIQSACVTIREAIQGVLRHRLATDRRVVLFGQDIEDPKGDVFGVTRGLSTEFPGRVCNSPLSESTIVGTAIGRALAGQRPVAFIQFADFLPLAYNQIACELGTMYWRTRGQWECPVIVMAACGAYRPGLGPFHSQTMESVAAHLPGVDVVLPSSAADAAGLLNAAFESGRPTLFFYPKALLNSVDVSSQICPHSHVVPLGEARFLQRGNDLSIVTWGAAVQECQKAVDELLRAEVGVDFIDLRSISPWDADAVLESAACTRRLIVVHEDNLTCGFGAEVAATVAEKVAEKVVIRRIVRPDTYIPCHFPSQRAILPSYERILGAASEMLAIRLSWVPAHECEDSLASIRAVGSGPADDLVEILALRVAAGDQIACGQVVAELEAAKSVVDVVSDIDGLVAEVVAVKGEFVRVGAPLLKVIPKSKVKSKSDVPLRPVLFALGRGNDRAKIGVKPMSTPSEAAPAAAINVAPNGNGKPHCVFLSRPSIAFGSRIVPTEEIAKTKKGWSGEDAAALTGVKSRHWATQDEDVVTLATTAAQALIKSAVESVGDFKSRITCVICSTTSPNEATPSISCRVAGGLAASGCLADDCHAFDINAACSGYLYGLRCAADFLHADGSGVVLLLTSEVLSDGADPKDFNTAFLFGDAATATLVANAPFSDDALRVTRPLLRTRHDAQSALRSPCVGSGGYIKMDGITVAREANKAMSAILTTAAIGCGLSPQDLSVVVPHPGSIRILQSVCRRLEIDEAKVLHTLADTGNTSSSSIPITLDRFWSDLRAEEPIGLVAFGAGFTSAAAIAYRHLYERGSVT